MAKFSTITLDEYLANNSKKRNLDGIIKKWFIKKEPMNVKKTEAEWKKLISDFSSETEK